MVTLYRQDNPPEPGPEMLVHRLRANESIDLVCISPAVWGCYTHWNGKCSEPCYGTKGKCPGHKRGLPIRWKGYLHIWDVKRKRQAFLELTPTSANELLCQIPSGLSLRGVRCVITRQAGDKARLTVNVFAADKYQADVTKLPEAREPLKTLAKLWGIEDLTDKDLGQDGLPTADVG